MSKFGSFLSGIGSSPGPKAATSGAFAGGSYNDESSSVVSDLSYTSTAEGGNWMKRLSSTFGNNDDNIDDTMRSLYGDPDALEEKCKLSISANYDSDDRHNRKSLNAEALRELGVKPTKTADDVIASLPEEYFIADFDPVVPQLEKFQEWEEESMAENFMIAIEETDTNKDCIVSKLSVMIESNYNSLMVCMRDVHAIDIDLARTGIQVTNGRRKLKSADSLMVSGTLRITELHHLKQRLLQVQAISSDMLLLKKKYDTIEESVDRENFKLAADIAKELLNDLQKDAYESIYSISRLIDAVQKWVPLIRLRADRALFMLCGRNFSAAKYSEIIGGYLKLDLLQESMGIQLFDPSLLGAANSMGIASDSNGCIDGLAERVLRYCVSEIHHSIRHAIIEFLPSSKRNTAETESVESLLKQISSESSIHAVVRLCELLCEVVHTHYLITQWHRTPFDERNSDMSFLHRCPVSQEGPEFSDEEEDDRVSETLESAVERALKSNGGVSRASKSMGRLSTGTAAMPDEDVGDRLQLFRLAIASRNLAATRGRIWEQVELAMITLMTCIHPSSAVAVEDFMCMAWCLRSLVKVGEEFCGATSNTILANLREKCIEYFKEIHRETFSVFRTMVECETWSSVPIKVNEMGGVIGIIKSNVRKRDPSSSSVRPKIRIPSMTRETEELKRRRTADLAAKYVDAGVSPMKTTDDFADSSIFMSFARNGNPFRFIILDEDTPATAGDDDSSSPHTSSTTATTSQHYSTLGNEFLSVLLEEDNLVPKSRRAQERSSAVVVTQSALNGLAKFTGKYLLMMHLMSPAASEIFQGLQQLFEYYLFAVFDGFVPPEDRRTVLYPPPRTSPFSSPPIQAKDFEALHMCMMRVAAEVKHLGFLSAPQQSYGSSAAQMQQGGQHASGVGAVVNSLYFGGASTAANLYSTLQDASSGMMGTNAGAASASAANAAAMRSMDLLKTPMPMRDAAPENMFALNERIVAAESCWFVAKILSETRSKIEQFLPHSLRGNCNAYMSEFQSVSGQLRSLVYRSMCPLLIDQQRMLAEISDESQWDTRKMREDAHDWVEQLVNSCSDVWHYVSRGDGFADASAQVREQVWLEVCQCAFDTVLEGFGRVRKCTTEGRASMAMDTTSLHTMLDSVHVCRPPRGKVHVDNYIRASYLSDDELIHWVSQNWQLYSYRHLSGLLNQNISSVMKKKKLKDAISALDALYDEAEREDAGRGVAGLLNNRLI